MQHTIENRTVYYYIYIIYTRANIIVAVEHTIIDFTRGGKQKLRSPGPVFMIIVYNIIYDVLSYRTI